MLIIDRHDLVNYLKVESVLIDYALGNEDEITRSLDHASREILAALRRCGRYKGAAIDGLTVVNTPDDLKGLALARALDHLTRGQAGRPNSIGENSAEAKTQISYVATGNYIVDGIERRRGARVRGASPSKHYFNDDCE